MKHQLISSPTLEELSLNSMKVISKNPSNTSMLNLKLSYSDYVCSTLSSSVERSSDNKVGQETITLMTVT